jgi:hypothetical protein
MSIVQIVFDPFKCVIEAYEALYNKPCLVQFVPFEETQGAWGFTEFFDDPSEMPIVNINVECPVRAALEVLAHELAHVEADTGCADAHGPEWQKAFEAIHSKYVEIVTSEVPEGMEVS